MTQGIYHTKEWRSARFAVLREEPLCRHCARIGYTKRAECVDHIVPISKGGAEYDRDNLQALCISCHNRKTRLDNIKGMIYSDVDERGYPTNPNHAWNRSKDG